MTALICFSVQILVTYGCDSPIDGFLTRSSINIAGSGRRSLSKNPLSFQNATALDEQQHPCTIRPPQRRLPLVSTRGFIGITRSLLNGTKPIADLSIEVSRSPATPLYPPFSFTSPSWFGVECTIAVLATTQHPSSQFETSIEQPHSLSTCSFPPFPLSYLSLRGQRPSFFSAPLPSSSSSSSTYRTASYLYHTSSLSCLLSYSLLGPLVFLIITIVVIVCYRQTLRCRSSFQLLRLSLVTFNR